MRGGRTMNPNNKLLVLKDRIIGIYETHIRYGKATKETRMRFGDIIDSLDALVT